MIEVLPMYVYGVVEGLALILLCTALLGAAWKAPRIMLAAVSYFVGVLVLRSLPLVFGAHTVLAIIVLALLLSAVFSVSIGRTLVAASLGMIVLIACEMVVAGAVRSLGVEMTPGLWLLANLPIVALLLAAAVLVRRRKLTLFPGRAAGGKRGA